MKTALASATLLTGLAACMDAAPPEPVRNHSLPLPLNVTNAVSEDVSYRNIYFDYDSGCWIYQDGGKDNPVLRSNGSPICGAEGRG